MAFNCAAPFRERLASRALPTNKPRVILQLCRPLSGAVSQRYCAGCSYILHLQLCRPLSGAVSRLRADNQAMNPTSFNCAAPFRERLAAARQAMVALLVLQLCRPLSGAVSGISGRISMHSKMLQLCRPLSGAVSRRLHRAGSAGGPCFNCAAPFRERLAAYQGVSVCIARCFNCAAPFRERLERRRAGWQRQQPQLQLCRPLSGAVSSVATATRSLTV